MHFKHTSRKAAAALSILGLLCALQLAPAANAASAKRPMPKFIAGADLSLLPVMEKQGIVYKDNGTTADVLRIMRSHGFNCIRLRLWVHPSQSGVMVNDLPYTIALAKRVKQAKLLLLLDIHYSDTWADPGKQFKPEAW